MVYKAKDIKLGRTVALKFLPTHLTNSQKENKRIVREAKAAAAINHPNICGIHAVEESDKLQFISMEYIDGITLRKKLQSGTVTPAVALEYGIHIASALSEAHEKGIVHRDIKPGNIMIDSKNRVKVMDFGLAKLAGSNSITRTGTTVGTVAYMAPEQIKGRPVDHRADLFSFGVLLFEMLTGQRPFAGQYEAALSYAIVNEDPPLLSDFLPNAPQKLSLLISRLLEKDPAKRYSDSDQLAVDLQVCLDQLPDSLETSQVTHTVSTDQTKTARSSGSGSTSITINFPSLHWRNVIPGLLGIIIVLVLISYLALPTSTPELPSINNTIAVLPLESISTEPEDIQFTDGVHEELINRLAGIGELTVIARSSVLGFAPEERALRAIGQELGVSSLMEGTVRRYGDQLRVSVQLVDANTLNTLWSGSFDENIDNVFEIQSRIARLVAEELQASLTQEEEQRLEERPTENPEAYRFYMQGREYLSRTVFIENNLLTAEELLKNAVEQDPEFAQAWGMLAYTYNWLYWQHGQTPEHLQNLGEAAEWALFYGPNLAETYLANGVNLYWSRSNNQQTLSHFETALQKFPNHPLLNLMTAYTHRRLGNWEQLIEYLNKALELDPLNTNIHTELAYDYWIMRDYDKAETSINRVIELSPDETNIFWLKALIGISRDGTLENYELWWDNIRPLNPAEELPGNWTLYNTMKRDWEEALLGLNNMDYDVVRDIQWEYVPKKYLVAVTYESQSKRLEAMDQYREVRNELELLRERNPEMIKYRTTLAKVYARLNENDEAIRETEKIIELAKDKLQDVEFRAELETQLAEIFAWGGLQDQAIDKLEYLLSVPSRIGRNWLRMDPIWDPLRNHPRFQELIEGEDEPHIEGL